MKESKCIKIQRLEKKGLLMNILYVESDKKLIDSISKNCSKTIHEIILLNNPKDAL